MTKKGRPLSGAPSGGIRIFQDSDFEWLSIISCLKQTGMPIKDIKAFIDWCIEGDATIPQRLGLIDQQRQRVLEQIEQPRQPSTFWITSTGITKPLKKPVPAPFTKL